MLAAARRKRRPPTRLRDLLLNTDLARVFPTRPTHPVTQAALACCVLGLARARAQVLAAPAAAVARLALMSTLWRIAGVARSAAAVAATAATATEPAAVETSTLRALGAGRRCISHARPGAALLRGVAACCAAKISGWRLPGFVQQPGITDGAAKTRQALQQLSRVLPEGATGRAMQDPWEVSNGQGADRPVGPSAPLSVMQRPAERHATPR
jgi:hypothetical protein